MKRNIIDKLILWKRTKKHKPVLLTGSKGVGKTYLAYDFSKAFFEHTIYINFEHNNNVKNIFELSDPMDIKEKLIEFNFIINHNKADGEINLSQAILILDEISLKDSILEKIDLLHKKGVFPFIIMIRSTSTDVELQKHLKNIMHIPIYPFAFDEFLKANNFDWYIETIKTHYINNKKIPDILHKELLQLHGLYLQIGGMPTAINEYINQSTTINISEQHNILVGSYYNYILKSNMDKEALKMKQVLDSLPLQLKKANKKFQYKIIRKGTTYAMYKNAIDNLVEGGYCLRCDKIKSNSSNSFKLYMHDVGLLYTGLTGEAVQCKKLAMDKALLENYTAQTLHSSGYPLYFWESDSMAKIEFIIKKDNSLIPIEIHPSNNTRSKSISVLRQKIDFPYAVKISSKNFDFSNQIKYVPYYAVFCI